MTQSYSDIAHDTLSACNQQGNVTWTLSFCGFIEHMFSKSIVSELDYTIRVTKLLYLRNKHT